MSTPMVLAASSRLVPLGTLTDLPSILSVTLSVTLASDHVHHVERGDDVRQRLADDQLAQRRDDCEAGRTHAALPGAAGAVGDDVEAELAVSAFGVAVDLAFRHLDAVD